MAASRSLVPSLRGAARHHAVARVVDVAHASVPRMAAAMLVCLPWFNVPGILTLPVPLSILLGLLVLARQSRSDSARLGFFGRRQPLRLLLLLCAAYWTFSAVYGMVNLAGRNKDVLHLLVGDVSFAPVAAVRVFLVMVCFALFEVARGQPWSVLQTMRWWLVGLAIAVGVHVLAQGLGDDLAHRGGLFGEGNHAGMYYLVSFFLALEYRRRAPGPIATSYAGLAVLGLLLTRSSTGVLVLAFTLWLREMLRAPSLAVRLRRAFVSLAAMTAIGFAMVSTGLDFGITDKLFGDELTPQTFSRIDRLMSINAAIELFEDSPIVGQGLQSYGFLSNDLLEGPLDFNYDWTFRRITNNIYAELAAETGVIGLLLLVAVVAYVVRASHASPNDGAHNLLTGLVAMLIYWFAFPTYSVAYLWIYMGLCCRDAYAAMPRRQSRLPNAAAITH